MHAPSTTDPGPPVRQAGGPDQGLDRDRSVRSRSQSLTNAPADEQHTTSYKNTDFPMEDLSSIHAHKRRFFYEDYILNNECWPYIASTLDECALRDCTHRLRPLIWGMVLTYKSQGDNYMHSTTWWCVLKCSRHEPMWRYISMWVVNIKFVNHARAFVAKIAHVCFFIVCGFL